MSPYPSARVIVVVLSLLALTTDGAAQAPVATIGGTVKDASGAPLAGASVLVREPDTRISRTVTTTEHGRYQIDNLAPATYEVDTTRAGFKTERRRVTLRVGDSTTLDFELQVGNVNETVEVTRETSAVNRTDVEVSGTIARAQIQHLPLNGRSFLELAQLQPAIDVVSVTNPGALGNNYQRVLVGGAYYSQTRISVDGSTVGDRFAGGTTQGFSQESVQEFQVATFSLDPATGVAGSGAINVVTRRGSNDLRGSAFLYYRDNDLAAYPGLRRTPQLSSPFFARRQAGASLGGPIRRDRLFGFANYERNNQDAVFAVTNNHPIFSTFDGIYPNPLNSNQFNLRLDAPFGASHQGFIRVSVDDNDTTAPAVAVGMPSNWQVVRNRASQVQLGLVSSLTPRMVNDIRVSYNDMDGRLTPVSPAECFDPIGCVGAGGANITVFDAPLFRIGNQFNSPFTRAQRTLQVVDNLTWQRGEHRIRAGAEWERSTIEASLAFNEPAQVTLWGTTNLQTPAFAALYDGLPASLKDPGGPAPTLAEILQLPLRSFSTGIGDPLLPGSYNFDDASQNDRFRFYVQDSWRLRPHVTVNYGLAYSVDTNLFAHDLAYPVYLTPIIGADLSAPRRDLNNFDPSAGIVWSIGTSGKTVIRAGGGTYHDESTFIWKARDRAFIGPSGNGRVSVDGSVAGLSFTSTPTAFRGQDLIAMLPGLRADLESRVGSGTDLSVSGIDVVKQGDQIVDPSSRTAYSIQANAGIQRELARGLMLTADYVMRRYLHVGALQGVYAIDRNRFNRPRVVGEDPVTGVVSFARDPIIPVCSATQAVALSPSDECSTGPINLFSSGASFRYQGLQLVLDKRYASNWQFNLGYALSWNTGFIDGGFTDYDDHSLAYGTIPNHRRHRLTVSGVWTAPEYTGASRLWRTLLNSWTVSFISQTYSAPPLNTLLAGLDLDGDGISLTLLPGTTSHNAFGSGLTADDVRRLVQDYNADVNARTRAVTNADGSVTIVRPRTPFNQVITPITLPEQFSQGDSFNTQDLRVTRKVGLPGRAELLLLGEAFNLFNIANLTGYSGVLNQPNYGQPSARVGQVFGTGGPRAFQFAVRMLF